MEILILGLALFLLIHLIPALPKLRAELQRKLGEQRYKAVFSILSVAGIVLIIFGYRQAPHDPQLFSSFPEAVRLAPFAMVLAFILLAAANMKTHIRHWIKHPMLLGVGIWASVHLLANGHAKASVLFGAFLAYAVIDLASAVSRHANKTFQPSGRYDAMAIIGGSLLAVLVMTSHRHIFGVSAVSWGI